MSCFLIRQLMLGTMIVVLAPGWAASAEGPITGSSPEPPKPQEPAVAPVILFDKLIDEGEKQYAVFRLTNPTDKVAEYVGPRPKSPSFVVFFPDTLTRKHVHFWEYWS